MRIRITLTNADPDLALPFNANPDPAPHQNYKIWESATTGLQTLHDEPLKLLNSSFDADPDPAFHSNADPDPDPASKNNADPCGSGSATLVRTVKK